VTSSKSKESESMSRPPCSSNRTAIRPSSEWAPHISLCAAKPAPVLKAGTPLSIHNISVQKVPPGGSFDLRSWKGTATHYTFDVVAGAIHSTQPTHSVY
jgi:hypothetical protein